MNFEYDIAGFLESPMIAERLLPEIRTVFSESYYTDITEEEIARLLTLKEEYHLHFDILHILDNHTSRFMQDEYYNLSSKIKDILGNFCYDYRFYSYNYDDFPR